MSRITIGHLELMKNSRFDEMIDTIVYVNRIFISSGNIISMNYKPAIGQWCGGE